MRQGVGRRYKEKKDNGSVSYSHRTLPLPLSHIHTLSTEVVTGDESTVWATLPAHPSTPRHPPIPLPWPPSCPPCGLDVHCGAALFSHVPHTLVFLCPLWPALSAASASEAREDYTSETTSVGDHLPPANTEPQINKTLTPTNTRKGIVWKKERDNYEKFTINHRFCLRTIT